MYIHNIAKQTLISCKQHPPSLIKHHRPGRGLRSQLDGI